MPINLPPQSVRLLWCECHVFGSDEDCGCIECVYGGVRLGFLFLTAGDGLFSFDTTCGHDGGGQSAGGKRSQGLRGIIMEGGYCVAQCG